MSWSMTKLHFHKSLPFLLARFTRSQLFRNVPHIYHDLPPQNFWLITPLDSTLVKWSILKLQYALSGSGYTSIPVPVQFLKICTIPFSVPGYEIFTKRRIILAWSYHNQVYDLHIFSLFRSPCQTFTCIYTNCKVWRTFPIIIIAGRRRNEYS